MRTLGIFAHPDDLEILAGGTFLHWRNAGWETAIVLLTSGNRGSNDPDAQPDAVARTRQAEARAAALLLGAAAVTFLGRDDGELVHDLALRRDIAREIRRFRPDIVVAQDPVPRFSGRRYINHPDHRAAGDAVLAAVYPSAKKPLVFPELLAEGQRPWLVRTVYLAGSPEPDLVIDIAPVLDEKIAAVAAHSSQFPERDLLAGFLRRLGREAARGTPLEYAESFRTIELQQRSDLPAPAPFDAGAASRGA